MAVNMEAILRNAAGPGSTGNLTPEALGSATSLEQRRLRRQQILQAAMGVPSPLQAAGASQAQNTGNTAGVLGNIEALGGALTKVGAIEAGGGLAGLLAFCWAAAEYYPWASPEWIRCRNWISSQWKGRCADVFRKFYIRHGRTLATVIRRVPPVRWALRPVFAWFARRGT